MQIMQPLCKRRRSVDAQEQQERREGTWQLAEAGSIGHIETEHDTVRATVVAACDSAELLLASSIPEKTESVNYARTKESSKVPNLHLHGLVRSAHALKLEIDAKSGQEGIVIGIVCITQQEAALANRAVANHDNLEEEIAAESELT